MSNLETTKQVNGSNSFVAPCPYYEYQLDLMFYTDLQNIKSLTKVCQVLISLPMMQYLFRSKAKQEYDIAAGTIERMHNMGKRPEIVYTDDEGHYIRHEYNHILKHNTQFMISQKNHAWFA